MRKLVRARLARNRREARIETPRLAPDPAHLSADRYGDRVMGQLCKEAAARISRSAIHDDRAGGARGSTASVRRHPRRHPHTHSPCTIRSTSDQTRLGCLGETESAGRARRDVRRRRSPRPLLHPRSGHRRTHAETQTRSQAVKTACRRLSPIAAKPRPPSLHFPPAPPDSVKTIRPARVRF